MQANYRPELDVSPSLDLHRANYYASLIGALHWMFELGWIDIFINMSLLSSFLAQPRIGHVEQVLHIFSYLRHHEQSNIVDWDESQFQKFDWTTFYKEASKSVPPNAPQPRGNPLQI